MKRTTVVTLLAGLLLALLPSAPSAASEGAYFSKLACVSYRGGHKSCLQVNWDKAAGPRGVRDERFKVTTSSAQSANFHKYEDVTLKWRAKDGGPIDTTYNLGTEGATVYRDVSNANARRCMELTFFAKANIFGQDEYVYLGVVVRRDGSSYVSRAYSRDVPLFRKAARR